MPHRRTRFITLPQRFAILLLLCSLAACGGGGGSTGSVIPQGGATSTPSPTPTPSATHSPTPTPSPSPTAPANTALAADYGYSNGLLSVASLQTHIVSTTAVNNGFQMDALAYLSASNSGILANGGSKNIFPFTMSGTTANIGAPIDISAYGNYASAVVMPDPSTAIVALNTTGDNYLLEVSNLTGTPAFMTIPLTVGPEDTAGLVMSNDGKVMMTRGSVVTVFSISGTPPYTITETSQINGGNIDPPDPATLRASEDMAISPLRYGGDYRALIAGTVYPGTAVGTVWLYGALTTSAPQGLTSTAITPSHHAYAVATDGKIAFVGTDAGIAIVPGVDTGAFSPQTTTLVTPPAGTTGQNLTQITNVAVTPDLKWLVVMGPANPSTISAQGYLDVLPITANGLGPAVESVPILVPQNDQLVVY
jgi:hypothetical protein